MLSVIIQIVVILNVLMLRSATPSVVMMSVFMQIVVLPSIASQVTIMLSIVMLSVNAECRRV
jgi:hypothetical protein